MRRIIVVPTRSDLVLRVPHNPRQIVPPEGLEVNEDTFWERRRMDGDVTFKEVTPEPAKEATPEKPTASKK